MQYIVSYDVSSEYDRYRTKIAQVLLDYGLMRIQYSVFFGNLDKAEVREIIAKINTAVKYEIPLDIRFFRVCQNCINDSYIISRDIKAVGLVVVKMEEAIKSQISYLIGREHQQDIDQRGWIYVYQKDKPPQKEANKKAKPNQTNELNGSNESNVFNEPNESNVFNEPNESNESNKFNESNTDSEKIENVQVEKDQCLNGADHMGKTEEERRKDQEATEEMFRNMSESELLEFLGMDNYEELGKYVEQYLEEQKAQNKTQSAPKITSEPTLDEFDLADLENAENRNNNVEEKDQSNNRENDSQNNTKEDKLLCTLSQKVMFI